MPPLIRRSQTAVPRHADEDGGHSGLGSHPAARQGSTPSSCAAGLPQRSVTGPAAVDARMRARCHPRQVPGSLPGAAASAVFMLAPRCTGRSRSWPFPTCCSRVRARGGEGTRQRTQPGQAPLNGPGGRRCHQLDPSSRSRAQPSGPKVPGNLTAITPFRGNFCFQLAWRSVPPLCRAGGMLSRNPGE